MSASEFVSNIAADMAVWLLNVKFKWTLLFVLLALLIVINFAYIIYGHKVGL